MGFAMSDQGRARSLLDVALSLTAATAPEQVLEGVTGALLERTAHSRASVSLLDPEGIVLRMAMSLGEHPVPVGAAIGLQDASPAVREAIGQRQTVLADYDSLEDPSAALASEYASHLALVLPISYRNRVLGVLALDDPGSRKDFSPEEIEFAEEIALLAGAGIATSGLVAQLQVVNEELGRANQELEAHMENSPLGIVEFDPRFRIVRWSAEAERIFGWSAEEVIGRPATELRWVHEDDAHLVDAEFARMLSGECVRSMNANRSYRKDGTVVECEWYSSAIHDADGHLVSILSEVLDITERTAAGRAAHEREKRLWLATDAAQLGVFEWHVVSDTMTWENDRMFEILGRSRDEALVNGTVFAEEVVHRHDREVLERAVTDGMRTGRVRVSCRVLRKSDGAWRWIELLGILERIGDSDPERLVGIIRDVTDRQRAEARILQHTLVLEAINTILAAGMSASSEAELGALCLEAAEGVTASEFGFIREVGADDTLRDIATTVPLSDPDAMHEGRERDRAYPAGHVPGLYANVLREGESVLTNEPTALRDGVGLSDGHPRLESFLGVPLTRDGETVGIIAVANRAGGYSHEDRIALEALAPAISQAFSRLRAERRLRESREDLARAQSVAHVGNWRLDTVEDTLWWSEETYRIFGLEPGKAMSYATFLECVHPEDREMVASCWEDALRGGHLRRRASNRVRLHDQVGPRTGRARVRFHGRAARGLRDRAGRDRGEGRRGDPGGPARPRGGRAISLAQDHRRDPAGLQHHVPCG